MSRVRKVFAFAALVALFCSIAAVVHDRRVAGARDVYLLNYSGVAYRVVIGSAEHDVGEAPVHLQLPEGTHAIALVTSAGARRELEWTLEGSPGERLLGGRVFVLNVDAAAPLELETAHYGPDAREGTSRLLFGELLTIDRVDHAFQELPDEAPAGMHTRLGLAQGSAVDLLRSLASDRRDASALAFASAQVRRFPDDAPLVREFARLAAQLEAMGPALELLRAGLAARPINMARHRAYQDLLRSSGQLEAAREEYAALQAAEPSDGAIRVLNARLAATPDAALAAYQEGLRLSPESAWAHYGVGLHLFRRARFTEARVHAEAAYAKDRAPNVENLRFQLQCAQGQWSEVASETAARRAKRPLDFELVRRHLEALAALGDRSSARAALQAFRSAVSERAPEDPQQLILLAEATEGLLFAEWPEARSRVSALRNEAVQRRFRFELALGSADLDAAATLASSASEHLALALARSRSADATSRESAKAHLQLSLEALSKEQDQGLRPWLQAERPSLATLRTLPLAPGTKACAILLRLDALADRAAALELAKAYAFRWLQPGPLLRRAVAAESP